MLAYSKMWHTLAVALILVALTAACGPLLVVEARTSARSIRGVCIYDATSRCYLFKKGSRVLPDDAIACRWPQDCLAMHLELDPVNKDGCRCQAGFTMGDLGACSEEGVATVADIDQGLGDQATLAQPNAELAEVVVLAAAAAPQGSIRTIYVAPSDQVGNTIASACRATKPLWTNEKIQMVALADLVTAKLRAKGFTVYYEPGLSLGDKIKSANIKGVHFYLSLHSNAAGAGSSCKRGWGPYLEALYYKDSPKGLAYAQHFFNRINGYGANPSSSSVKKLTPCPGGISPYSGTTLGELKSTYMPAVIMELGFHDYQEDMKWFATYMDPLAQKVADAVADV